MIPGAGVRSLDALKDWYASLSLFRAESQEAQTSLSLSLQRAADYLTRQQVFWKGQIRKFEEEVSQAKIALSQRRWKDKDGHHPDSTVQEEDLELAKARLLDAEEHLEATRRWQGKLPTLIHDVYDGPAHRLAFYLDIDLAKALADLAKQLAALEQYLGLQPTNAPSAPAAPVASAAPAQDAKKDSPT